MNLTLKQLQILHAVVMAGSISQATRTVGLSQPTLSQHLAKFEEELGTQLIVRGRSAAIKLTAAGEFWFKVAAEVMDGISGAEEQHRVLFDEKNLTLRFGTAPSLHNHFAGMAARTALDLGHISHFEFAWANSSEEVVEMMNTHRLNCGIVSAASIEGSRSSLHVEELWRDRIVWIVPAGLSEEATARVLDGGRVPSQGCAALSRYVKVTSARSWSAWSQDWFRHRLPCATPFFASATHQVAAEIVASGLATCHAPMSLLHDLPDHVRSRIRYFDLNEHARDVVLIMPRHLLSLAPFKAFCEQLTRQARQMMLHQEPAPPARGASDLAAPGVAGGYSGGLGGGHPANGLAVPGGGSAAPAAGGPGRAKPRRISSAAGTR